MIVFLVHGSHAYTHELLVGAGSFELRIVPYRRILRAPRLRTATYVFTDFDRLHPWELELAGRLHKQLRAAGAKVLNDPARVRQRFSLLRTLKERGVNDFDVWRVEDTRRPDRYPVFLRREWGHRGAISDLLHDEEQARSAVEAAVARGIPARDLLLVEYRAEPVREGLFRKLGAYRVGDRIVSALPMHQTSWSVKLGQPVISDPALYDEAHEIVTTNRYAAELWPAFEAAEIEYGRADFGLAGGRVQVYEINTNPHVKLPSHPISVAEETSRIRFQRLVEAFEAIDTPVGGPVELEAWPFPGQRRHDRGAIRGTWVP